VTAGKKRFVAARDERLDRLVTAELELHSRSQVQRLIERGCVSVDGELCLRPGAAITSGARISVELPPSTDLDEDGASVPLVVLFEDEETLVINKQPDLLVHPVAGRPSVSLLHAVRARYPEVRAIEQKRSGVVHRLDRDTSGVIAFAKSEAAREAMRDQWRSRDTLKLYLALVAGRVQPSEGIIDAPIGVDPDDPRRRAVVERGVRARSEYRVLEQYGDEAALVRVCILTGRTHQIRVHFQAVGHPVVGDAVYGRPSELIARQALHASRLGFRLASTGAWREFEARLPDDMIDAIAALRARHGVEGPPLEELIA
jgi:23S rRNA pseudouridine1911/1915/1917 synthase